MLTSLYHSSLSFHLASTWARTNTPRPAMAAAHVQSLVAWTTQAAPPSWISRLQHAVSRCASVRANQMSRARIAATSDDSKKTWLHALAVPDTGPHAVLAFPVVGNGGAMAGVAWSASHAIA